MNITGTINLAILYRLRNAVRSLSESTTVGIRARNISVRIDRRNATRLSRTKIEFSAVYPVTSHVVFHNRRHIVAIKLKSILVADGVLPDIYTLDPAPDRELEYEWVFFKAPYNLIASLIDIGELYGVVEFSDLLFDDDLVEVALVRPVLLTVDEVGNPVWKRRNV